MSKGACVGMAPKDGNKELDLFFPGHGNPIIKGQWICYTCPVRIECKEHRDNDETIEYGLWGGEITKRGDSNDD